MHRTLLLSSLLTFGAQAQTPGQRAAALLARMNLTEKVTLLHGVDSPSYTGSTAAVPAQGIPALHLNDGRQGFRPNNGNPHQTAFPCQLAAVATWDAALWQEYGQAFGTEWAGKGANIVLAPMLILARVPEDGRAFESVGEDPELAYHFARAHITGVQSVPGVMANADDYVCNNQETDRGGISAVVDRRTLAEIYYRGYQGAVAANVGSFMCSYNLVNGTHACENAVTLGDLKNPAGLNFSGFVLSDWGGTHSTVASALAGLDQEMPGASYFGDALIAAVQNGQVPQSAIDDKALRVLTAMFAAGIMDLAPCPSCTEDADVTSPAHTDVARRVAAAGTVLLQNNNGLLPINPSKTTNILVVGDDASVDPYCCGAGSGGLSPPYVISPLAGITARAGAGANVTYIPSPVAATALIQWYSPGRGDHFLDFSCDQCPAPGPDAYKDLRVEAYASATACPGCLELGLWWNAVNMSNLVAAMGYPAPPGYTYVRPLAWALPLNYSGAGTTAVLELWSGYDTPTGGAPNSHLDYFTLATNASRAEAVAARYTKLQDIGRVFVNATAPDMQALMAAAAAADVVVLCVSVPSSEGSDRPSLNLTASDDAMVAAVTGVQPSTVVVLNNPGAIVMPWRSAAGAILSSWYPGQEMGNALADVLFGDTNPSGRLPLTFPVSNADTPMQTQAQYPGIDGVVTYTEKLQIGYRWWAANGLKPAFPFGHGLSYSSFTYSGLSVQPSSCSGVAGCTVTVSFTVTNSKGPAGREVPQLYVGFPPAAGEPPFQLRGFTVVDLAPGASQPVSLQLVARDLSVWDEDGYAWALQAGSFSLFVGASSADVRLTGTLAVSQ